MMFWEEKTVAFRFSFVGAGRGKGEFFSSEGAVVDIQGEKIQSERNVFFFCFFFYVGGFYI